MNNQIIQSHMKWVHRGLFPWR